MLAEGSLRETPEARASFRRRLEDAAARIPDKALAGEYRAMLLERFFAERRRQPGGARFKSKQPAAKGERRIDADVADATRGIIMTAMLLAYPEIFPEVEEAFARVSLPPSCMRIRDGLHQFTEVVERLDMEALFTHLGGLGLAEEARLIIAVAAEHYRPAADLSPADVAKTLWSWHPPHEVEH